MENTLKPLPSFEANMIDKRTKKQIKRLFAVVTDDSLMDADFEYVKSAIACFRNECNQTEAYMKKMDKLASEVEDDSQSQLDASSYHGHSRDYVSLKIFTEQLERENADIRKDKERLDWLEKSDYELYEPNTDSLFAEASREAIDEAMEEAL